ncbi:MAG: ABC transporter substrate-binding protein [Clostridiales Family XIII bacterium]|nr:ABC transporter substrate-binding protein [Clostridiales Family XIII bacterium]
MKKMKKKRWLSAVLVLALAAVAAFSGCGGDAKTDGKDGESEEEGLQVIYNLGWGPSDPAQPYLEPNYQYMRFIFNTPLVYNWIDREGKIGTDYLLAESVEPNENHTQFVITLREGLKWHDGESLTADDLVFSQKFWAENPEASFEYFGVESQPGTWVADDERTVTVTYEESYWNFLDFLDETFYILPEHIFGGLDGTQFTEYKFEDGIPVGNGPFKYKESNADEYILLERFEDYYEPAEIQYLRLQLIDEDAIAVAAMQSGEIDVTATWDSNTTLLEADPTITVYKVPDNRVQGFWFNQSAEFLDDENIRKAIASLVNTEDLVQGALSGIGRPWEYAVPSFAAGYSDDLPTYATGVDEAKKYVEASGYTLGADGIYEKEGKKLSITWYDAYGEGSEINKAILILQQEAKKAGIDLQVQEVDDDTWSKYKDEKSWTLLFDYFTGSPNVGSLVDEFRYASDPERGHEVRWGPYFEEFNATIDAAEAAYRAGDDETAVEKIREVYTSLVDRAIFVPTWGYVNAYSANNRIDISKSAYAEFSYLNRISAAK